jgi:hypothetical protein
MADGCGLSCLNQGDQIGRIFANWWIVFFGQFSFELQKLPKLLGNFFRGKGYALIWAIKGLVNTLVDFSTNSSGPPATIRWELLNNDVTRNDI